MYRPFREYHILSLLEEYNLQEIPIDKLIHHYFRSHKALGSKDRAYIAETVYGMIRWMGLIDYLNDGQSSWEDRYQCYQSLDPLSYLDDLTIPEHIRVSFPGLLYEKIGDAYGKDQAQQICLACNQPAPTTVRANRLKISRDDLLKSWQEHDVIPCSEAPCGITFQCKILFTAFPEFKKGFFEMQDEASQIVAEMVQAEPGQSVMDYCAGAGGKTLAFAPFMKNKGQIYLHDIRRSVLSEAKKRLRRAGVQNVQFIDYDSSHLKKLKKKMDWVLVDAPCSGTGTLRRNPDMKWRFSDTMLTRLIGQQREIFEKALSFLKPGGKIVYVTCSILKEENEQQLEHFMKTYDLDIFENPFSSIPRDKAMDGFFAVTLVQKGEKSRDVDA